MDSYDVHGSTTNAIIRTFHATHFSVSQRRVFFAKGSSGPSRQTWSQAESAWSHGGEWSVPEGTDLEAYNHREPRTYPEDHSQVVEMTLRTAEEGDDVEGSGQEEDHDGILSKEAIAIFEFSQRFRREKALAELKEKSRLRLRRIKRRKLTKLGFALTEGNSDESENDLSHGCSYSLGWDGKQEDEVEDEEEDEEEDEDEDDVQTGELPPTDISFMSLNEKLRGRIHRRLYASNSDEVNTSEIRSIEMLEDLLNQTYNDIVRQDGVVYWPGMPLRC